MLLAATSLSVPMLALAAAPTSREAELEARLLRLEAEMSAMKADLQQARADRAAASTTEAAQALTIARAAETKADAATAKLAVIEATPQPDGFKVGGTTWKMGGFVKVVGSVTRFGNGELAGGSLGKEFFLPQQIPVGGAASTDVIGHARQTRLFFSTSTPVAGKALKGHVEFDFALAAAPLGAQRATNAYTPTFRRGFISYGNLLIGQEWTTFQNPAHLPESTDFVGPMDGSIFVRQMMVQYRQPLSEGLDLYLAAENPQTETITSTSAAMVDNDQDRMPDLIAKLAFRNKTAELHVAGLVRSVSVHSAGAGDNALGWGATVGGKIMFGPDNRHDVRFMGAAGRGIGRYFTVGFVPDAIYDRAIADRLNLIGNVAGWASVKLGWTDKLRSTFMAGYQHADYPDSIPQPGLANVEAWSVAGNLFWSPVRNLDFGIEYRHAVREVASGLVGTMDRVEMAAKYTF
ncbi:DcaP family trimeric outer membrane transporter [Novosphingobium sp.]|uniref:DcaP family trimeric outer membrane transporter n=1 Tax=Novosphingobium sp. TaxID=1874826 RepID=UPI0026357D5B|nr:DcaP family trimeric outer membrane transporter [Novosphingobium sp.]